VTDGSAGQGTSVLPEVSPTVDWVRFPVRIDVEPSSAVPLRIGEKVSVSITHHHVAYILQSVLTSINP
jgi:multidrug resistance efflux pump